MHESFVTERRCYNPSGRILEQILIWPLMGNFVCLMMADQLLRAKKKTNSEIILDNEINLCSSLKQNEYPAYP